ncbi:MAG: hypothetical protein KDH95_01945 [Calditrichaeota bacterium]|nr:hypothetical protein [Calditrichota bacterium]MCB0266904.1 hypothetical protein [Calditrichota bacterium]
MKRQTSVFIIAIFWGFSSLAFGQFRSMRSDFRLSNSRNLFSDSISTKTDSAKSKPVGPKKAFLGAFVIGGCYGISTVNINICMENCPTPNQDKYRTWRALNIGGLIGSFFGGMNDHRNSKKKLKVLRLISGNIVGGLISYHIGKDNPFGIVSWCTLPPIFGTIAMAF